VGVSTSTRSLNIFENSYNITLMSTDDDGRVYQYIVIIHGAEIDGNVTLNLTGRYWFMHYTYTPLLFKCFL